MQCPCGNRYPDKYAGSYCLNCGRVLGETAPETKDLAFSLKNKTKEIRLDNEDYDSDFLDEDIFDVPIDVDTVKRGWFIKDLIQGLIIQVERVVLHGIMVDVVYYTHDGKKYATLVDRRKQVTRVRTITG